MALYETFVLRTRLSANDRKVGWVANECLQPFLFSGWTNLSGAV